VLVFSATISGSIEVAEDNEENSELKIRTENIPGMNAKGSVLISFLYRISTLTPD
jgi:hypothetical protein